MMRLTIPRLTGTGLAAAVGGGLAAVLLSMITLQRPPLTVALGFVAPLPVMIAALGFGWPSGLIALLVGVLFIGAFDLKLGALAVSSNLGTAALDVAVFCIALGVPAVVLARLAGRPVHPLPSREPASVAMRPEERRLGAITLAAVLFSVVTVGAAFAVAIVLAGGLELFNAELVKTFEKVWQSVAESRPLPANLDVHKFAVELTWALAPMMSAVSVIFYVLNLWLAARTAQTSGLLAAPWMDIPQYLRLPRVVALVFAVALGLSFVVGVVGYGARIVSAALAAALALQGLAVTHATTRGRTFRFPLLTLVYVSLVLLFPWPLVFWAFFGLLDLAFSFRDRHQPRIVKIDPSESGRQRTDRRDKDKTGPWDQGT